MQFTEGRKLRVFTDADITKIGETYHLWRTSKNGRHPALDAGPQTRSSEKNPVPNTEFEEYTNTRGYCHSATLAEVQKQDYKLTPGIYVGTETEADDGIPFKEKMDGLKTKLNEQFQKSNELQERIKENLNLI